MTLPLLSTVKGPHVSVLPAAGKVSHPKAPAFPPAPVLQQYWVVRHPLPLLQHSVSMGPMPQEGHPGLHAVMASEFEKTQQISCVVSDPTGHVLDVAGFPATSMSQPIGSTVVGCGIGYRNAARSGRAIEASQAENVTGQTSSSKTTYRQVVGPGPCDPSGERGGEGIET